MSIRIEDNVPKRTVRRGRPCKYPWRDLAVGQSFFVDVDYETLRKAARQFERNNPERFTVAPGEEYGARAWRDA